MPFFHPLQTQTDFQHALEQSAQQPVVLFKHSATCPISAWARRNVQEISGPEDPPVYEVVVQRARPLSNLIAAHFGIRHESPQVIVLYAGRPIFDASHYQVRPDTIRAAVAQILS